MYAFHNKDNTISIIVSADQAKNLWFAAGESGARYLVEAESDDSDALREVSKDMFELSHALDQILH